MWFPKQSEYIIARRFSYCHEANSPYVKKRYNFVFYYLEIFIWSVKMVITMTFSKSLNPKEKS